MKAWRSGILLLLFAGVAPASVFANCQNGTAAQTVSGGALDTIFAASTPPCTITVNAGTYSAAAFRIFGGITVVTNGSVTLQVPAGTDYGLALIASGSTCPNGANVQDLILRGGRSGVLVAPIGGTCAGGVVNNVTLRRLNILSTAGAGNGIEISANNGTVVDSNIVTSSNSNGILVYGNSTNVIVSNNTVTTTASGHGIALQASSNNQIVGNTVSGTKASGIILNGLNGSVNGPGSSFNRIEKNSVSGHGQDGITISDFSKFNYIAENIIGTHSVSSNIGAGIWLNNASNGNYVYGNVIGFQPENGIDVFQSSNNFIQGNRVFSSTQGGIFITNDASSSAAGSVTPANTFIHHNYAYASPLAAMIHFRGSSANDVAFNFMSGRQSLGGALGSLSTAGLTIDATTASRVYENTVASVETRAYIFATTSGLTMFRNRFLDGTNVPAGSGLDGLTWVLPPAGVLWDASVTLGGNHWSEFAAVGDPSPTTPYSGFIDGNGAPSPYTDNFPFKTERLGRNNTVNVLAPFTGQIVAAGSTKTIRWQSDGCAFVDIYYKQGGSATLIEANYPNTGYYLWSVPSALAAGSYSVALDCNDSTGGLPGVSGLSGLFTVGTNALVLLTPGRDYRTPNGSSVRVSWKNTGVVGGVNVFVKTAGGAETQVATNVLAGFADVTLPGGVSSSNKVILRIQATGNPNQQDAIDEYMSVRGTPAFSPVLTGSSFQIGTVQLLRWVGHQNSYTVDLDLMEGATSVFAIARNLPDFGNYTWLVPEFWSASSSILATFKDLSGNVVGTASSGAFRVLYTATAGALVPRYRLYGPVTLEHLFTTDLNEYNVLGGFTGVWQQEGVSSHIYNGPVNSGGVDAGPYYRLYDKTKRWHHWTADRNEYFTLRQFTGIYNAEGVDGYVFPSQVAGSIPLFRLLYVPIAGLHHWTVDVNEKNTLLTRGWIVDQNTFDYVFP